MSNIASDYCLICGKAKGWTRYNMDATGVPPDLCICISANNIASPVYYPVHLTPEQMQALEAMMRRVVAEELAKMFPPEEEQEEEDEEAIRPFIGQD